MGCHISISSIVELDKCSQWISGTAATCLSEGKYFYFSILGFYKLQDALHSNPKTTIIKEKINSVIKKLFTGVEGSDR